MPPSSLARLESETLWRTCNYFEHCISVQLSGARGLPEATEIFCEVQAAQRVRLVPLLLSQTDLEAGGGGRVDGGRLSERLDLLTEIRPAELEVRLVVKARGPMWTQHTQKLIGRCDLADWWRDALTEEIAPAKWIPLHGVAPDGEDTKEQEVRASFSGRDSFSGTRGPALLLRVQCFERLDLDDASARSRLFAHYSSEGSVISRDDFEHILSDVASGRRDASGALDAKSQIAQPTPKGAECHACVGNVLASVGFYQPETSLLSYLMYYHTLFWVVCRAPGEEHIPIMHRLSSVTQGSHTHAHSAPSLTTLNAPLL